MFGVFKKWRRKRLKRKPFPSEWLEILRKRVPYYGLLNPKEQQDLQGHIRIFLSEKQFEGCGGLEITDEIRVTIAAHASILLLNRPQDYYPGLQSILVYPSSYIAQDRSVDAAGIVSEGNETRSGEAWLRGAVILSWDDVQHGSKDFQDGHNVTLHEFAHQLDQQDGVFDGAPLLEKRSQYTSWARILRNEYEALRNATERGQVTSIDQYGATNPAEFFAVITEMFFENPKELKQKHPELYEELKRFFHQDTFGRLEASQKKAIS
jgi:Mlc titration factor MtfA (ptsG expression regulator)